MEIKYRILKWEPEELLFWVRYYTDVITEDELATEFDYHADKPRTIKRDGNGIPTKCRTDYTITVWKEDISEEEVKTLIQQYAPVDWFAMMEKIKNPQVDTSMSAFEKFEKSGSFNADDIRQKYNKKELSEEEIDNLIAELHAKNK